MSRFQMLPLYIKCIFVGTSLSIAGLFFNWFSSADSFQNGISYNGFGGPTYIMGYTIFVIGVYSLGAMLRYLKSNGCEVSQLKKYYVEKWSGVVIMYLSLVMVSIYMSSAYLNKYDKSIGTGFFITLAGTFITISGSILFKTKNCDKIGIDKNQLNLELGDIPEEEVHRNDTDFGFNTNKLINSVIGDNNEIEFKELAKKQKEIEAKISQK